MTTDDNQTIRAVVFRQGGLWVAHCLEVNVVVSTPERSRLPRLLRERLRAQILADLRRGVEPLAGFGRAERRYFELYERSAHWTTTRIEEPLLARLYRLRHHLRQQAYGSIVLAAASA